MTPLKTGLGGSQKGLSGGPKMEPAAAFWPVWGGFSGPFGPDLGGENQGGFWVLFAKTIDFPLVSSRRGLFNRISSTGRGTWMKKPVDGLSYCWLTGKLSFLQWTPKIKPVLTWFSAGTRIRNSNFLRVGSKKIEKMDPFGGSKTP